MGDKGRSNVYYDADLEVGAPALPGAPARARRLSSRPGRLGGVKREVYYDADLEVGAPAPWGAPKLLVVLHVFAGEVFFNVFVFADEVFDFIGEVV